MFHNRRHRDQRRKFIHISLWISIALIAVSGCTPSSSSTTIGRKQQTAGKDPVSSSVQFVDVTEQVGIHFTHRHGGYGQKLMPETMGSGGAFLDYNSDGHLDILLINTRNLRPGQGSTASSSARSSIVLYRNNGNGTFTDATAGSGLECNIYAMGCCIGDYDNDGKDDIFVTACKEANRLFHNEGGGKFRDVAKKIGVADGQWGTSCAWLDYDRDGWLDLFVCRYVKYEWAVSDRQCFNHPDGSRAYCDPRRLPPQTSLLYHSEAGKLFQEVSAAAGITKKSGKSLGVAFCDYDRDGWPDILVANDTEPNFLFHNRRNGTFEEVGLDAGIALPENGEVRAGMGIDASECFNDGKLAVMVSNFSGEGLSLYYQDKPAGTTFTDISSRAGMLNASLLSLGFGLFFFDYDNDGWQDAFSGNGHIQPDVNKYSTNITYGERNFVFHNRKNGIFEEVGKTLGKPLLYERVTRGAAYGDYDNDGDLDILVTNNNQPVELLRNDGGNRNNWLQVELKGKQSNRDGIGAYIVAQSGDTKQTQRIRSGSSYLSQSMLRSHFGLGDAKKVDRLEIHWPGTKVDEMKNVQANQSIVVREGEGIVSVLKPTARSQ